jgi:hypothetical protein
LRDLTLEKERIVKEHMNNIVKTNNEILETMNNAIKDKKISAGGEVGGFLESIKAMVNIGYDSTLEMNSGDRLEFAKLYFQNADNLRKTITEDVGYTSLLKNMDEQFGLLKEQIKQIDKQLAEITNEDDRERLMMQRDDAMVGAEPPSDNYK